MASIILLIFFVCFLLGIRYWKNNRIVSLLYFTPVIVSIVFTGYFIYQSNYVTDPDSLHLSVKNEKNAYSVTGVWKDRLDFYRFPSDFLVFYVPNNEKVLNVERDRIEDFKEADWKFLNNDVSEWAGRETHSKWEPQIFDLQTDEKFTFSFVLPENVNPSDVEVYYAHTREEPMDALEFWFKAIDLH